MVEAVRRLASLQVNSRTCTELDIICLHGCVQCPIYHDFAYTHTHTHTHTQPTTHPEWWRDYLLSWSQEFTMAGRRWKRGLCIPW